MIDVLKCSSCGSEIEHDVPFRQCPKCLLDLGLSYETPPSNGLPWEIDREPALPDYEILERIGRGGMGFVYRARQRSLDRTVALKLIGGGELASPAALARFRREAETAAKLDHPNIVPIYEVGEHETNPFLVMRFIEGASLAERLGEFALRNGSGRAGQCEIARLIAMVARAVHYAHDRGVLHRDLKPSNIILDQHGNPHLTDFGIAKSIGQETDLTQTSELVGTPCYMAPEQAEGGALSPRSDVYSLGIILYELLTGRKPFEGEKPMETLRRVIEEEPTHPNTINPAIDRDLTTICLKCLDKNPARRYSSGLALAEDLERWQRREPILARPAGPILRLRRWTARNPALATLIAGLVVGIALTLVLLAQAREEKARKSIALAILRTETARQLQEIWSAPNPFFAIKSETLSAMAGREPAHLRPVEKRFTIAFVAAGNPLDRVLAAAPLLEHVEGSMSRMGGAHTRLDLRLYKTQAQAVQDLLSGHIDFLQMNAREYLRARINAPDIQPLVKVVLTSPPASAGTEQAVIFVRADSGIRTLSDLRGRSFLFSGANSTMTLLAKAYLVEAGIRSQDLLKYRYVDRREELLLRSTGTKDEAGPDLGNPFSEMTPVEAVLDGTYDAAVATERRFLQVSGAEKLVLLKRFQDRGSLVVGQGKLPAEAAAHFRQAMVNVNDSKILQPFSGRPTGFEVCTNDELADLQTKLVAESVFDERPLANNQQGSP
jgi:ABC-type phosphate/phosphonate transport system substrate-binding protein